jgi:hypothetical protein
MDEHLFDPAPFGPGTPKLPRRRPPPSDNDGSWWLLALVAGMDSKVHRKSDACRNAQGADTTVCGRRGRLIPVPPSTVILAACRECISKGVRAVGRAESR